MAYLERVELSHDLAIEWNGVTNHGTLLDINIRGNHGASSGR
jgi:hypothetical protein